MINNPGASTSNNPATTNGVPGLTNPVTGNSEATNAITLSPNLMLINYMNAKSGYPFDLIEKKLNNGQVFESVAAQGSLIDNAILQEVLNRYDFYEKETQRMQREDAMIFLKSVVEEWSIDLAINFQRVNQQKLSKYKAKLLQFGSYVLDLKSNTSDIDLICVCPKFISRSEHFFTGLFERLSKSDKVKNITARPNAQVPIINFLYKDIDIDISYCRLGIQTVPDELQRTISSQIINGIEDEQSRTSLLGRVHNLKILEVVPAHCRQNFKTILRIIKVWAKNRGISSNGMGFLGGISWAILAAKICQMFPNYTPAKLLAQFFKVYSIWDWKNCPIYILPSAVEGEEIPQFQKYLMCVVTPGSIFNSTKRVNEITFRVLNEELVRANQIFATKKSVQCIGEICKKHQFFQKFQNFLQIDVIGTIQGKEEQKQYKEFCGLVQSRILSLLNNIILSNRKYLDEQSLVIVPNPHSYNKNQSIPYSKSYFIGVQSFTGEISLFRAVKQWCTRIYKHREKKNLNVRVFETIRSELTDIEIQVKKKIEEKEDPRLMMRKKRKQNEN